MKKGRVLSCTCMIDVYKAFEIPGKHKFCIPDYPLCYGN